MSDRATAFLAEWVRDNLYTDSKLTTPETAREALASDAHRLGIGLGEFEEDIGDIEAYLADALLNHTADRDRAMREAGANDG